MKKQMQKNRNLFKYYYKYFILSFIWILILFLNIAFSEELVILHTNDFHGRIVSQEQKIFEKYEYEVAGAEYISSIINNIRNQEKNVLLLDAGDFSAGTIYSNLSYGQSVVDFYNYLNYDAVTIGNHEFDFGYDNFLNIVKNLKMPVLCANANPLFKYTKPYVILNKNNLKIAVIGLLTPETEQITMPKALNNHEILDPIDTLNKYKSEILSNNPDLVIALTHLGVKEDEKLAKNVDYIDIIIGGHSHTTLYQPINIQNNNKNILIFQTGSYGKYIGYIKLNIDNKNSDNKKIDLINYKLYPTINKVVTPDKKVNNILEKYISQANKYANQKLGFSNTTFDKKSKDISNDLGILLTNIMVLYTKSDIAFYNTGGIRDTINKGNIVYGQIFNVLPFENMLITVKMKGKDIIDLLNNMENKKTPLKYNSSLEFKDNKWLLNGQEILEDKEYKVATIDFLYYGGDGYTEFKKYPVFENYGYIRDIVADYIKNYSPLNSSLDPLKYNKQ
ncbi:MAG: bifunctional metallophosphatase/5'-nucleotidase [bacterium]